MSKNRLDSGVHADALPAPAPLDRYAVLRSLERERLSEEAPDLARERIARIVRVRDEIRRGVYVTEERLAVALGRALGVLEGRIERSSPLGEDRSGDDRNPPRRLP